MVKPRQRFAEQPVIYEAVGELFVAYSQLVAMHVSVWNVVSVVTAALFVGP